MRSLRSLLGSASPGGLQPKIEGAQEGGGATATPAEDAPQTKDKSAGDSTMTKRVADSGFETSPKCKETKQKTIIAEK